ncbi:MAG: tRNA (guanosine(37)-N1)-methyltransferase TrmD [Holosporales bacterium]|jgi:tRNA (guanine37-N1)-methyltransferase|nr:tRNA (guanosine(37)-N1)-methyltransferase TrmD [Holosporales bacterium]
MHITVLTLFPEIFPGPLGVSLIGKALRKGLFTLQVVDIKAFARQGRVDSPPCGGGCGMILAPDVLEAALASFSVPSGTLFLYPSPRGRPFSQEMGQEFSAQHDIVFLCGRYEGVDVRFLEKHAFREVSLGDYVLMGGEIATLAFIEASVRLIPGVVGDPTSLQEDSLDVATGPLLEYPQYTTPVCWEGRSVPSVLLSGNHGAIQQWRQEQACAITRQRRPDLWKRYVAKQLPF